MHKRAKFTYAQSIKARYKDPGAEGGDYGVGSGQSWILVTFASKESVVICLTTKLQVEGDRPVRFVN